MTPLNIATNNLFTLVNASESLDNISVSEDGRLIHKPTKSILSWSYWYETDQTAAIKETIKKMFFELNAHRNDETSEFECNGQTIYDREIRQLVFGKLLKAGKKIFDPLCLYSLKNIQNILVPKLKELRTLEKQENFNKHSPEHKMNLAIAKANLMFKLRIGTQINTIGATGSIVVKWFDGKGEEIGLFKPESSQNVWNLLYINYFQNLLGMQVSHLSEARMARPEAEVAAHILDHFFDIGITCPTKIACFCDASGSFQLWSHGMVEAADIRQRLDAKPQYHPKEVLNYQKMAILSYILGDLDGHDKNSLVKVKGDKCLIDKIVKIDNANTFIKRNPSRTTLTDCKQYAWKEWNIGHIPFTKDMLKLMQEFTPEKIEKAIDKIRREVPGFLDVDIIKNLRERASVLYSFSQIDPPKTPKVLGEIRSDEQIKKFLKNYCCISTEQKSQIHGKFNMIENYQDDPPETPKVLGEIRSDEEIQEFLTNHRCISTEQKSQTYDGYDGFVMIEN